jgi:hypothetical protein
MASNPNNHALVVPDGTPESSFFVTPAETQALDALGTERAAL